MPTEARLARMEWVLDHRQPDLTLLLDRVHKPHNLSAILRTCDAVGVGEVHAVFPGGQIPTHNEVSAGSHKWVQVQTYNTIQEACLALKQKGLRLYLAKPHSQAQDFRLPDYTQPTAFILGAEYFGVSEEAATWADEYITIPMYGMVQSLNVSVAAAVLLYEAQRQRAAAGLYAKRRLSPAEKARLLEEWRYR
ncbi:MAG: tRNA (guanosine(18)-2'-O)-methyltransferase TrmH [Bacteroidia bacterium]|nr:tRNA (guanosine(18)-2'-O)-methyltransferase TrmH [Bacteroidia bacterium]MDW8089338.1 tRNA (guanosine(18)-2'-O)-methyltransferase TrmH [Bacteroidia bacterium]